MRGIGVLYPEIEPYEHGMLDVGDGNHVYWETCGNPRGKPVLVLHGGPGSGCTEGMRRYFDPDAYRIVLFDQRGCGRSTPHASDPATDLSVNTTRHLISDIELLRRHLGIDGWQLFGGSWGATLALVYAERYPRQVSEIVLTGVTTTRRSEIDWLYHGAGRFFPGEWERFRSGVPEDQRDGDLVEAYHRLLHHPDPRERARAAEEWCAWELSVMGTDPDVEPDPVWTDPEFRMAFARIVTHYFRHGAWLAEGSVLREAAALRGIPGVLVHGRLDVSGPPVTAWEVARVWPDAELHFVPGAGHSSREPGMAERLVAATDRFARG
ncbi:prolyl aminopeptidase [Haloechinothrix alba]|uniref:prolyl aminopeptidase n=1 Tax=Haloechinothrix alba TaxID=664784 RepID=UPI001C3CEEA1|nr:prolyl aminopeptidase [Haloechinothrix alba]